MPISNDLFLAILSMDAYNRGYGAGIADSGENDPDGLGGLGSVIGNATVINQDISSEAQAAGFYAVAYELNGQTIISYRGTDGFEGLLANDIYSGWAVGAGIVSPTTYSPGAQGQLALDFYQDVTGENPFTTTAGNAVLTGHSLGSRLCRLWQHRQS